LGTTGTARAGAGMTLATATLIAVSNVVLPKIFIWIHLFIVQLLH